MSRLIPQLKMFKFFLVTQVLLISTLLFLLLYFAGSYYGKIFKNVSVANVDVAGTHPDKAASILKDKIIAPENITIIGPDQKFSLKTSDIGLWYDFRDSSNNAYNLTRSGDFFRDAKKALSLILYSENIELTAYYNQQELEKFISVVSGQSLETPIEPFIEISYGNVNIKNGYPGTEVDQSKLRLLIHSRIIAASSEEINLPVVKIDPSLTDDELQKLEERVERYVGKKVAIKHENKTFNMNDNLIIKLIDPITGYKDSEIYSVIDDVAKIFERPAQIPKFRFKNGVVSEFLPAIPGVEVRREELKQEMVRALDMLQNVDDKTLTVETPVSVTQAPVTNQNVNSLGIKELIGVGKSTYLHSIPGRVFNVALAASRIDGTLVFPGQTFSFNETLGDVSKFTGYKEAYIISGGKTILGDGGGVCQVSTTLFRAALDAGLPIDERRAHAYRVGYYEQSSPPGFDATVYAPITDFKFTNDTQNYILIQALSDPKNYSLVFELYGTKDGRVATTTKPTISNVSEPPPDSYQDDPTLPAGTIKQVDFKAWGAKVAFEYKVQRNGQEIFKKVFVSNYRPWQAVFLRGTATTQ